MFSNGEGNPCSVTQNRLPSRPRPGRTLAPRSHIRHPAAGHQGRQRSTPMPSRRRFDHRRRVVVPPSLRCAPRRRSSGCRAHRPRPVAVSEAPRVTVLPPPPIVPAAPRWRCTYPRSCCPDPSRFPRALVYDRRKAVPRARGSNRDRLASHPGARGTDPSSRTYLKGPDARCPAIQGYRAAVTRRTWAPRARRAGRLGACRREGTADPCPLAEEILKKRRRTRG